MTASRLGQTLTNSIQLAGVRHAVVLLLTRARLGQISVQGDSIGATNQDANDALMRIGDVNLEWGSGLGWVLPEGTGERFVELYESRCDVVLVCCINVEGETKRIRC